MGFSDPLLRNRWLAYGTPSGSLLRREFALWFSSHFLPFWREPSSGAFLLSFTLQGCASEENVLRFRLHLLSCCWVGGAWSNVCPLLEENCFVIFSGMSLAISLVWTFIPDRLLQNCVNWELETKEPKPMAVLLCCMLCLQSFEGFSVFRSWNVERVTVCPCVVLGRRSRSLGSRVLGGEDDLSADFQSGCALLGSVKYPHLLRIDVPWEYGIDLYFF